MYPETPEIAPNCGSGCGPSSGQIAKETPFGKVFRAHNMVTELVNRLESLARDLVGDIPESATNGKTAPARPGLLGSLEFSSEDAQQRVIDGFQAIERIRSALP